jgi:capsule polysaccharide export protein KpsC/LpsZ
MSIGRLQWFSLAFLALLALRSMADWAFDDSLSSKRYFCLLLSLLTAAALAQSANYRIMNKGREGQIFNVADYLVKVEAESGGIFQSGLSCVRSFEAETFRVSEKKSGYGQSTRC